MTIQKWWKWLLTRSSNALWKQTESEMNNPIHPKVPWLLTRNLNAQDHLRPQSARLPSPIVQDVSKNTNEANCNFLLHKMVSETSLFTTYYVFSYLTILEKRGRSFPPVHKHVRPTCSQLRRLLLNFWTKHVQWVFLPHQIFLNLRFLFPSTRV